MLVSGPQLRPTRTGCWPTGRRSTARCRPPPMGSRGRRSRGRRPGPRPRPRARPRLRARPAGGSRRGYRRSGAGGVVPVGSAGSRRSGPVPAMVRAATANVSPACAGSGDLEPVDRLLGHDRAAAVCAHEVVDHGRPAVERRRGPGHLGVAALTGDRRRSPARPADRGSRTPRARRGPGSARCRRGPGSAPDDTVRSGNSTVFALPSAGTPVTLTRRPVAERSARRR